MDASIAVNQPLSPSGSGSLLHLAAQRGWHRLAEALVEAGAGRGVLRGSRAACRGWAGLRAHCSQLWRA